VDGENLNSGIKYVVDNQHFYNYNINSGGELVICAGATLQINNLNMNGGSLYIAVGGSITLGNMNGQGRTITNYGTLTLGNSLYTGSNDNFYNAGSLVGTDIGIQGSSVLFTNASTGVISIVNYSLMINTGGLVNNGIINVRSITINSGGICLGNQSGISCENFTNNALNALNLIGTSSCLLISGNVNNNQAVTNTSNTLNVSLAGSNAYSNWGTAVVATNSTSCASPQPINVYYSKATGSLNNLNTWGSNLDGSGVTPLNFTSAGKTYIITNQTNPNISADWTISGNGCVLIVGDDRTPVNAFITGGNVNFTGTMVITAKSYVGIETGKTATFQPGSSLLISSTSGGDGSIGTINGSINGLGNNNVLMSKFIPAKASRKWSFVTSPLGAGKISQNWQHQIHVTGPLSTGGVICTGASSLNNVTANTDNGLDPTPSGNYSMYYFDPTVAPATTGQWKPVTATNDNTTAFQLNRGSGFRVLVRGPRIQGCALVGTGAAGTSPATDTITLQSLGNYPSVVNGLVNGEATIPYTVANGNTYVMMGNPFICAMDFNAFATDPLNSSLINNKYWLYSPEFASGTYSTYASGVLTNRPSTYASDGSDDKYLASWQAAIVQLTNTGTTNLSFKQSFKYINTAHNFVGTFGVNDPINNLLNVGFTTASGDKLDGIAIRFVNDSKADNVNNTDYDAVSLNNGATQYLQTVKGDKMMAIQTRVASYTNDTVALNVVSKTSGNFKFNASGFESFTNTDIYLIDKLNGTKQLLNNNSVYNFSIDINDVTTFGANRFQVVFGKQTPQIISTVLSTYKAYPVPLQNQLTVELPGLDQKYSVRILNASGSVMYNNNINSGVRNINTTQFASGIYLLEITDANGNRNIQKIVKFN
jgi:hypothetical protein